ncbi:hypothetical protein HW115_18850 [Verrucomicrobiaceae bacterium N1E253]|uniref:Uncharacterized protein n=1 Tax=Oceaniferula marina TaxID=2748318 RepID=A0A851GTQ1_9BACT|nr:hypothetical protein [Oceaniferula marina]NWK57684.1 hypothetical protein [Oceaniferula marina]
MKNFRIHITLILIVVSLTHVSAQKQKRYKPSEWPGLKYSKVIAVTYDYTQNKNHKVYDALAVDGAKLSKGIYLTSQALSKNQIKRLFKAITDKSMEDATKKSLFEPHHAFIFYDVDSKIIGSISLDFNVGLAIPLGEFAPYWDFKSLKILLKELGMEFHDTNAKYTQAYKKQKS